MRLHVGILLEAGIKAVLLVWDPAKNKVALKAATRSDKNAFAVSLVRDQHSGSIRAKSFLNHIGWSAQQRVVLPAIWGDRERMLEITLPREHLSIDKGSQIRRENREP
jgi:hypothetical protein